MEQNPDLTARQAAADAKIAQARTDVVAEITRTDAKAAALLSAVGLPLAVLVAVIPGRDLPTAATVLVCIGTGGLVAAMLTVLQVLRPRLGGGTRGSYLHWATCSPEQVAADLADDRTIDRIVQLSRIGAAKYRSLRLAVDITAGALVVLLVALVVAAL